MTTFDLESVFEPREIVIISTFVILLPPVANVQTFYCFRQDLFTRSL